MSDWSSPPHDPPHREPQGGDVSPLFERAKALLDITPPAQPTCYLARAPGRLDVMGGIAEYTGALVLGSAIATGVAATVQLRDDHDIVIRSSQSYNGHARPELVFDASFPWTGEISQLAIALKAKLHNDDAEWAGPAAGGIYALRAFDKIEMVPSGLTVVLDCALPLHSDAGWCSASVISVLMALARAWDTPVDPAELAHMGVRVQNDILEFPCGISACFCSLFGQPGTLVPVDCRVHQVRTAIAMPPGIRVIGIESGLLHKQACKKYVETRVAGFMGKRFIEEFANHHALQAFNGCLAQLSVRDYVNQFRDRIPTRMRGRDFIQRFNDTADPLTSVDPDTMYRVRSRTEHHIYEAARSHQFSERLAHAARTGEEKALIDAGELMYASHWSYGQRCGLGSIPTDRLVNLLKKRGVNDGIYGAKISGHGAGGIVVALVRDSDSARAAIRSAVDQYENESGLRTTVFDGESVGALHFGIWED